MLRYTALVRKLNGEVQAKKALALGDFQAAIDLALTQLSSKELQGDDPNLILIRFLDQHFEVGGSK